MHIYGNIDLNRDNLFNKIVNRKKERICYETNYFLYLILKDMGYNLYLIGTQTKEDDNFYDYPIIKVIIGKKYLFSRCRFWR